MAQQCPEGIGAGEWDTAGIVVTWTGCVVPVDNCRMGWGSYSGGLQHNHVSSYLGVGRSQVPVQRYEVALDVAQRICRAMKS